MKASFGAKSKWLAARLRLLSRLYFSLKSLLCSICHNGKEKARTVTIMIESDRMELARSGMECGRVVSFG